MTDRDRLINELKKAKNKCLIYESGGCLACKYRGQADCTLENLADHLLENGVMCPPCKIGNTVWWVDNNRVLDMVCVGFVQTHKKFLVTIARNTNDFTTRYNAIFNEEVFLAKEEAEEKLKEREQNAR